MLKSFRNKGKEFIFSPRSVNQASGKPAVNLDFRNIEWNPERLEYTWEPQIQTLKPWLFFLGRCAQLTSIGQFSVVFCDVPVRKRICSMCCQYGQRDFLIQFCYNNACSIFRRSWVACFTLLFIWAWIHRMRDLWQYLLLIGPERKSKAALQDVHKNSLNFKNKVWMQRVRT